jgi:isopropylmalate/homocitrate/citramalate synthase
LKEVTSEFNLAQNISITDSTLREGEETPFVVFSTEQKMKIAGMLDSMGVDEIDCGFASINDHHFDFLETVHKEGLRIKKSVIVRIDLPNFEASVDRMLKAGADIILCGFYATPIEGYTLKDYLARIERSVRYCKRTNVFTAFWATCTRWEKSFVEAVYKTAIDAGADRIKTAGGGVLTVSAYKNLTKLLKKIAGPKEVGIHAHNHYGLATAYALSAVEAGAENIETSVNGLGDGAGLAPFEEVIIALKVFYGCDLRIRMEKIMELSKLVQELSGVRVQCYKPFVGSSVFLETPETHLEAILRSRLSGKRTHSQHYVNPEFIGQRERILFGPSALGGPAIGYKAKEIGLKMSEAQVNEVIGVLRKQLITRRSISEEEVEHLIREIGGEEKK